MRLGTLLSSNDHGESIRFAVRLCIVRVRVWGTLVRVRVRVRVTLLASTSSEYQV